MLGARGEVYCPIFGEMQVDWEACGAYEENLPLGRVPQLAGEQFRVD